MNELTAALKEELNVDTAFTLPIFGGIDIPESIAVSWGIMAFLVIVSILLTRNLKVNHISKRQAILETQIPEDAAEAEKPVEEAAVAAPPAGSDTPAAEPSTPPATT